MRKWTSNLPRFLIVFIPYLVLVGGTIYSYGNVEGDLPHDLPKALLFVPAVISFMLPSTYGVLLFAVPENSRPARTLLLGVFMGITLLVLTLVVYLFANS
ncbi:MAG: hypothetical protein WC749_05430 [Dehalococcoidia bacterium]